MDIALLFFLPLIGGFHFARTFLLSRYQTAREETQRVYYKAALYGILLSVIGGIVHYFLIANSLAYEALVKGITSQVLAPLFERPSSLAVQYSKDAANARAELALICAWGFALGILADIYNAVLHTLDLLWRACRLPPPSFLKRINRRAIRDELEGLLSDSLTHERQIQITLNNGKVYVGLVMETLDPASNTKSFKIQPFMSGYRNKDNGRVEYTTFYQDALPDENSKQPDEKFTSFQLIIPISTVVTASGFNLQAFAAFSEKDKADTAKETKDAVEHTKLTGQLDIRLIDGPRSSDARSNPITRSFIPRQFCELCSFIHSCAASERRRFSPTCLKIAKQCKQKKLGLRKNQCF